VSIPLHKYEPEHFGDMILEGVLVRNARTFSLFDRRGGIIGWKWELYQDPKNSYVGPYPLLVNNGMFPWSEVTPPKRDDVIADIKTWLRACLSSGGLRADAFEAA
jgi:hypothetical protein